MYKRSLSGEYTGSTGTSSGSTTTKSSSNSRSNTTTSTSQNNATHFVTYKYQSSSGMNQHGHQFAGVRSTHLDHRRDYVTTSNNNSIPRNTVMTYNTNLDNYRHKSTGASNKKSTTLSSLPSSCSSSLRSRGSSSYLSSMTRK